MPKAALLSGGSPPVGGRSGTEDTAWQDCDGSRRKADRLLIRPTSRWTRAGAGRTGADRSRARASPESEPMSLWGHAPPAGPILTPVHHRTVEADSQWVFPVPGGPRNTTFSRAVTKSRVPR